MVGIGYAQFSPQYIWTKNSIVNHIDEHTSSGSSIHVYKTLDGIIYEPDHNGTPHGNNVLIASSKIGAGVDPALKDAGIFSISIPKSNVSDFFVRVFDKGFYIDSEIHTITSKTLPINIIFNTTMSATDERDFDGDGLNNSWEKTYGTDINVSDTDGDGYTDEEEVCLNTDPNNSNDVFTVYGVEVLEEDLILTWDAKGGVEYVVQKSNGDLLVSNLVWEAIETNFFGIVVITNKDPFMLLRVTVDCQ